MISISIGKCFGRTSLSIKNRVFGRVISILDSVNNSAIILGPCPSKMI